MQTFKRARGVKNPDFWQEKMKGWEGSTPEGKNKVVVMLDRVDVPEHIARTCRTPEQRAQAGGMAAHASLNNFFRCIDMVMGSKQQRDSVGMIRMQRVGLCCEGRGGCYDLFFFPDTKEVYAAHTEDDGFVCTFVLPEKR